MEKTATPQAKPKNKHFWNFQPASGDNPPELILYGDIASETWWGDEVTPRQFTEELDALGAVPEIVVRINSGGGDVFAANAIYTRLKDNAAKITVKIDGWAASGATIIAMAGDSIEIPGNGVFMVHDPALGLLGYFNETELAKMTDELKVIKQSIVNAYTLKTGKDAADVAAIMAAETWYDGKQAVDAGFCDKLMFEDAETTVENAAKVVVNSVSLDLTRFPNMPVSLLNRMTARTPSGFSNKTNHKNTEKERNTMDGIEKITTVDGLKAAFEEQIDAGNDFIAYGETLDELAEAMKVDVKTFKDTVDRYNELCEQGEDVDFGKEAEYLHALENGPFYAVSPIMNFFGTLGGIAVDRSMRVLRADGTTIEGLYASGVCACDLWKETYNVTVSGGQNAYCCYSGRHAAQIVKESL